MKTKHFLHLFAAAVLTTATAARAEDFTLALEPAGAASNYFSFYMPTSILSRPSRRPQ